LYTTHVGDLRPRGVLNIEVISTSSDFEDIELVRRIVDSFLLISYDMGTRHFLLIVQSL
jgi:hypothetical protein